MKKLVLLTLFASSYALSKTHVDVRLQVEENNERYLIDKSITFENPLVPVGDKEITIDLRRSIETDKEITIKSKVIFKDTLLCEPLIVIPFGEKATVTFSKEDGSLACSLSLRPHRENK
jgi:hypothetical protein